MKVSALLLALLAVLAVLAACGDGGQPGATSAPTVTTGATEGPTAAPSPAATVTAPAAGEISFESDRVRDGVSGIYTVNADGTDLTPLAIASLASDSRSGTGAHVWSPDGTRIAFNSGEAFIEGEGNQDIYIVNADGSGLTRLTDDPANEFLPKWSPDGERIAFISDRDGNLEIYVMNADGSGQTNLTNNPADDVHGFFLFSANPWSPNGERIAFNRGSFFQEDGGDARLDIYVMNADGTGEARLTDDAQGIFGGWSSDGEKILLFGGEEGFQIYVMNADGTGLTRLISLPGQSPQGFPVWSPDGQRIAFTADRDGKDAIYLMNADGSGVTPLTTGTAATGFEGCDGLFGTAWSPDGKRIAFSSGCDSEKAVVLVINADGSGETRVADAPAFSPAWSPGQ